MKTAVILSLILAGCAAAPRDWASPRLRTDINRAQTAQAKLDAINNYVAAEPDICYFVWLPFFGWRICH